MDTKKLPGNPGKGKTSSGIKKETLKCEFIKVLANPLSQVKR